MGNNPSYFLAMARNHHLNKEETQKLKALCIEYTKKGMSEDMIKSRLEEDLQKSRRVSNGTSLPEIEKRIAATSNANVVDRRASLRMNSVRTSPVPRKADEERKPELSSGSPIAAIVPTKSPLPLKPSTTSSPTGALSPRSHTHNMKEVAVTTEGAASSDISISAPSNRDADESNEYSNKDHGYISALASIVDGPCRCEICNIDFKNRAALTKHDKWSEVHAAQLKKQAKKMLDDAKGKYYEELATQFVTALLINRARTAKVADMATVAKKKYLLRFFVASRRLIRQILVQKTRNVLADVNENQNNRAFDYVAPDLSHEGTTFIFRTKELLTVNIYCHEGRAGSSDKWPVLEVVALSSLEGKELPRLYVSFEDMKDLLQCQLEYEEEQDEKEAEARSARASMPSESHLNRPPSLNPSDSMSTGNRRASAMLNPSDSLSSARRASVLTPSPSESHSTNRRQSVLDASGSGSTLQNSSPSGRRTPSPPGKTAHNLSEPVHRLTASSKGALLTDIRKGCAQYLFKHLQVEAIPNRAVWPTRRLIIQLGSGMLAFAASRLGTAQDSDEAITVATSPSAKQSGGFLSIQEGLESATPVALDPKKILEPFYISEARFCARYRPAARIRPPLKPGIDVSIKHSP